MGAITEAPKGAQATKVARKARPLGALAPESTVLKVDGGEGGADMVASSLPRRRAPEVTPGGVLDGEQDSP